MARTVLAFLALFAFAQTAGAQSPQAFEAYKEKVRSAVSAAVHQEVGEGRTRVEFRVSASGKVAVESVKAKNKWLKQRLGRRLALLRVPPPAWTHPPLRFHVVIFYGP